MKFGNLEYLYLLWVLPLMILLGVYAFRSRDRLLRAFADPILWGRLMPGFGRRRQVFKFLLLLGGVSFLLMAFLSPRWGFQWQEIQRRGVDLLVAVDVSKSMLAEDIKPNRLERAKREITDLIGMLKGDRIGLIAFAGSAFLECPLTLDYGAFQMFLDYLDTDLIPVPGTDVGGAIRTAIRAFVPGHRASRALILITDGEDHSKEAEKAAEEAKKKGIRIFTVGIGSEEGAPIPLDDGSGGFKKDRSGELILTRLDEASLQKIALVTGGSYVRSVSGDMDLKKIYDEIREKMEAGELETTKRRRWEERFQWFLLGAILLVCLEAFLSDRKRPVDASGGRRGLLSLSRFLPLLLTGFALCPLSPSSAWAESLHAKIRKGENAFGEERYDEALQKFLDAQVEDPENILLKYDIGEAYYRMHNFPDAEAAFRDVAASADPALEGKALYNLGNCAYRQGKLEDAVAYYQQCLERNNEDEDARFNLEFVREEIKRRMNEAKEREKQQEQQQQQKEGQSCPNPKQQSGAGDSEKKQEQSGQQQAGQPEQKPSEESKSGQKEQQQAPSESQAMEAEAQPAQPEGKEAGAGQEDKQNAASAMEAGEETGSPMSQAEAERWLNSLDDEQKDLAKQQIQKALGQGATQGGKDW